MTGGSARGVISKSSSSGSNDPARPGLCVEDVIHNVDEVPYDPSIAVSQVRRPYSSTPGGGLSRSPLSAVVADRRGRSM
jgi:hypothetical protein